MAKLTKEELINKVAEKVTDTELQIELMEDITDSFEDGSVALGELQAKFDELQEKYRQRFLNVEEVKEEIAEEVKEDNVDEIQEEEVIDIQEI
jgi:hypothetical protein